MKRIYVRSSSHIEQACNDCMLNICRSISGVCVLAERHFIDVDGSTGTILALVINDARSEGIIDYLISSELLCNVWDEGEIPEVIEAMRELNKDIGTIYKL